ncbi:MAG: LPS-assembly protein LptD [Rhodospirillales bacterium]|nr:LPS-assembly protein LptD [Rhodospirillales bacterium]
MARRSSEVWLRRGAWAAVLAVLLAPIAVRAQPASLLPGGGGAASRRAPIGFTADQVRYERNRTLVVATGHVEAWQNNQVLRADKITFDRTTGVATASGHVTMIQPDGTVLYARSAVLSDQMRNGVLQDLRARLAQNAKLAANAGKRTEGVLDQLSKVVYSTCNLCKENPYLPPLWQLHARTATEDAQHKRIEFTDAEMQVLGVPVAWFPYFWTADPSVKRASGILIPSFGTNSQIGAFFAQPYYWVIDGQSDATITPMITTRAAANLGLEYRRRFNSGDLTLNGSVGYLNDSPQATIYSQGQFNLNNTWRWGFNLNRASSAQYVRDFTLGTQPGVSATILSSQVYAEGFGEGAYARLDTRFYQGLDPTQISDSQLPVVLPHIRYRYFGQPDALGGRFSLSTGFFNVLRTDGTNTRRGRLSMEWDRPFVGVLGDLWTLKLHVDSLAYNATKFNLQPNFGPTDSVDRARALPQVALDVRWPFMRNSGAWGTQVIEPIAELIAAPAVGASQNRLYPNEDSFDFEFTDANLFGFNRFPGVDRLDGGMRANVGLHAAWYLAGTALDGLIGQSFRTAPDPVFPVGSGLHGTVSDIVGRLSFTPASWLDLTYRTRLDHRTLATRMADATASVGGPKFQVTGGYLYTTFDPYYFYDQPQPPPAGSSYYFPRNELTLGASTQWGQYQFDGFVQRDLARNQMVAAGADVIWQNECLILDFRFFRRYTGIAGDHGSTTLLLQITFKTIGQFGFRAL